MGKLGPLSVVLIDISLGGARVEHHTQITSGSHLRLSFEWEGRQMQLEATVLRSKLERFSSGADGLTVYHSGLCFRKSSKESEKALREMISWHITRAMEEQKANARGYQPPSIEHMPIFRSGVLAANRSEVAESVELSSLLPASRIVKESAYICCRLVRNAWKKTRTTDPEQPDDGFTVSAYEDVSQIEILCDTYRLADEEGRRLIKTLAEMSIAEGEKLTQDRFNPSAQR
jgi:hypothetical protein